MTNEELIKYIAEGRVHVTSEALSSWVHVSEEFAEFTLMYKDKIRSKLKGAKGDEDLKDVMFELWIAFDILKETGYKIEYEKYGDASRAPDYTITSSVGNIFNLEVKRIRESSLGVRYEKVMQEIVQEIRIVPSKLAFSFSCETLDVDEHFIINLESSKETIIQYIKGKICEENENLSIDNVATYPIPGVEDDFSLILSKPAGKKSANKTSYYGGSFPMFYTGKEFRKVSDAIFEKIGQMLPGHINILVIDTDSTTHEYYHLQDAIESINERIKQKDDDFYIKKGFKGLDDFLSQANKISGILFKSTWCSLENPHNYLWCNSNADYRIPEDIQTYLIRLGKS